MARDSRHRRVHFEPHIPSYERICRQSTRIDASPLWSKPYLQMPPVQVQPLQTQPGMGIMA
jgi:hypothetical protein